MDLIQSILLGLIQGIVEWLPISSQGQTMLIMIGFLGINAKEALSLAIFLHLGTMSLLCYDSEPSLSTC